MFVPGYTWDHDYVCFWAKETQSLIAREWKRSVATGRHHPAPDATVSGLGLQAAFRVMGVWLRLLVFGGVSLRLWRGLCPTWGKPTTDLSAPGPCCCRAGGGGRLEMLGRQGCRCSAIASCQGPTSVLWPPLPCSVRPQLSGCAHFPGRPPQGPGRGIEGWNRRLEHGCVTCTCFLSVKFI